MEEDTILELIMHDGGMTQYTDATHPDFDVYTSLLLADMRPDLFTKDQIAKLKNLKELDSSFKDK